MGKAKSSIIKDAKKNKKPETALKKLESEQQSSAMPASKSLNSLIKIKHKLDSIILQRKKDKESLNELKKKTNNINKQIKKTETQLTKRVLNKDLQKLKTNLEKKQDQLENKNKKFSKELKLLNSLANRIEGKIDTLKKPPAPDNKNIKKTNKLLTKKITQFEDKLNQFSDTIINPDYLMSDFSRQIKTLSQLIDTSSEQHQDHDTQIKLLQSNSNNIRQLLHHNSDSFKAVTESHQHNIESHQRDIESQQQDINSQQRDIESQQQVIDKQQQDITDNRHSIDDHQHELDKIQQDINHLQETEAYTQQNVKKQQENNNDSAIASLISRLDKMDKTAIQPDNLADKTSSDNQLQQRITQQLSSQKLTLEQQRQQHSKHIQTIEQQHQQLSGEHQQLQHRILSLEETQQTPVTPLQVQFNELENDIQSLQQHDTKNQQDISDNTKYLAELSTKIAQINTQLKEISQELKQNIQSSHESGTNKPLQNSSPSETKLDTLTEHYSDLSEQSTRLQSLLTGIQQQQQTAQSQHNEIAEQAAAQQQHIDKHDTLLTQLNPLFARTESNEQQLQQISNLTEQSARLQSLLTGIQQQQKTAQSQHNEVAEQAVAQQQHIDKHDTLLTQLNPLFAKTESNEQQLQQISATFKQLDGNHNRLVQHEDKLQSDLVNLTQQLSKNTSHHQEDVNHLSSKQQLQLDSLEKTNKTLTTRSQLFLAGFMVLLAASVLLFYFQNDVSQSIVANKIDKQVLISQIKTALHKDNTLWTEQLIQQNSQNIRQQFNDIRETIQTDKKQSDQFVLHDDWQEQQQLMQKNRLQAQSEQEKFQQTITALSQTISAMELQIQQLKNISSQASIISGADAINHSVYGIQLLGARNKDSIIHFIKQHDLSETSRIIKTDYQNKPWYILVQGHYTGFSNAQKALQQLPEALKINNPWIKKLP